jgi:membrane protease YdiL (CAAX protease family)
MPPALLRKAEHSGRFLFFLKYTILLLALRLIVGRNFWRIVPIKLPSHEIMIVIGIGIIVGLLAFACRRLLVVISPTIAGTEAQDDLLRGPLALWLVIFVFGAFTEEVWRALCILALQQNGYGVTWALLLPAFAFAVAHLSGLPPRIPGGLENIVPEAGIGFILGALIVWSGSILPASLASMIYYTSNVFWLRWHHRRPPTFA